MGKVIAIVAHRIKPVFCALLLVSMLAPIAQAESELPEVSSDGLHLLKTSKVRVAYVKPGVDLTHYSKVKLLDCYVDFKKNWQKEYNLDEVGLSGQVKDKDAEKIKDKLAAEFRTVFTESLTKAGYPVVEDIGSGVLLLRPALLNVDVSAPDILTAGPSRTLVKSAGDMTLFLELYDASTSTLLARIIDPRADNQAYAKLASGVTNKAAADRILRTWANLLAENLADVREKAAVK